MCFFYWKVNNILIFFFTNKMKILNSEITYKAIFTNYRKQMRRRHISHIHSKILSDSGNTAASHFSKSNPNPEIFVMLFWGVIVRNNPKGTRLCFLPEKQASQACSMSFGWLNPIKSTETLRVETRMFKRQKLGARNSLWLFSYPKRICDWHLRAAFSTMRITDDLKWGSKSLLLS